MASEEHEEVTVSITLSRDLREWLDEQAAAQATDRETLLERLLLAHREVATDDPNLDTVSSEQLAETREEFRNLLEDVRKRVVQVKRETDAKTPTDDHEALAADLERAEADLDDLADDVERLAASVDAVEADLESGFENFEEVLEYLTDRTETLGERVDTLARAVVDARSELRRLGADAAARTEADRLKLAASQHGIAAANCEACDSHVDIGLLTEAECPHCATAFDGVEPKDGFFGSHTLTTGEPPALAGTQETKLDSSLDDLVESEPTDPPEAVDDGGDDA
jgi:DNA repair exonuclease SbcCD ATPase subunit